MVYPLTLTVVQPAAGGQQLTFPVAVKVVGNLDTAASAVSTVSILFRWDGTTVTGRAVTLRAGSSRQAPKRARRVHAR